MKKWLFNPFTHIAGAKALIIGWLIILLTAIISIYSKTHFDGAIDTHIGAATPVYFYFAEPVIDWVCTTMMFYLAAIAFSKSSVRFIDIGGTMALARWPMLFSAIIDFGIHIPATAMKNTDDILKAITPTVILAGLADVLLCIWMIALMYNAFSVSANIRGGKAASIFTVALIVAEVLSKVIFYCLL